MNDDFQCVYWYVGEGEWRFQISTPMSEQQVLSNFKGWTLAGEGTNQKENKSIKIFSRKFKNRSDLEVFVLRLKKKNKISIKEV